MRRHERVWTRLCTVRALQTHRRDPWVKTYRFVIGLVAVVASGQVSYGGDTETAAHLGIRPLLAVVVAQALKQAADDRLVVADEIGVLADVVAVPGDERERRVILVSVPVILQV